jgi:hypothetical protein
VKLSLARLALIIGVCAGWSENPAQAAGPRDAAVAGPVAIATNADTSYCFARVRGLDPGRLPQSYLVLKLRVRVSYQNEGSRPLIVPLERERTVYTALKPGPMSVFHEPAGIFPPAMKVMKELPADVSADNPVDPANDVFAVVPARGEMKPPLLEEIVLPVNRTAVFRHYPDLRGQRVYIKLQFVHRELSGALTAKLSDRWFKIGVPWTGKLTTNTFVVDVPANPQGLPCNDSKPEKGAVSSAAKDPLATGAGK